MTRKIFTSAAALALATTAFTSTASANMVAVEEVDVTFDIEAIESKPAAAFWADIEGDLETAILERVTDSIEEEGAEIIVDISELDISNTFQSALGADSTLNASIAIKSEVDPTIETFYDAVVRVEDVAEFVRNDDGGTTIVGEDADAVYALMIDALAENVVSNLIK